MEKPIIEIKNIGKKYNITHQRGGYIALRDVLMNVIKSPFSFLKSKVKQVAGFEKKEDFWALRDVNFSVKKGEVIGIIGSNGAGKSTLLKILSQITPPTEGEIILRGRVGSLLEVGTGFHPELTGRENIFLNGAILGMKKKEIAEKFDEIVEFAGIGKFLDTPVKYYSSGMYVRLAFSVAAHMEPDILIVDEVLAVGDAEFQKKCLGKMEEVTQKEGRTILFVSHNMAAVKQLCSRTIVLAHGNVIFDGQTEKAIANYREIQDNQTTVDLEKRTNRKGNGIIKLTEFYVEDDDEKIVRTFKTGSSPTFVFSYKCSNPEKVRNIDMGFTIEKNKNIISTIYTSYTKGSLPKIGPSGKIKFAANDLPLASGTYNIEARILADDTEADWPKGSIGSFEVLPPDEYENKGYKVNPESIILINGKWL